MSLELIPANRTEDFDLLSSEIQDKTAQNVAAYYPVFRRKWKELSGIGLVLTRI
jgi:SWI/SNF-related matrix-associated actin-dependent regulator of chromatin subfamily A member 5